MSACTVRAKKPISPQRSTFLLRGEHSDLPSRPGEGNQCLFPLAETNQATQITGKSQKWYFRHDRSCSHTGFCPSANAYFYARGVPDVITGWENGTKTH
ncbi:hypothetical protein QQF64_009462 [Cirrhinus molitorella]|uniref:Uncharacterized protein n=1 Tax=Cirrhinus molitorella TaxID=172907 RepID=A0ABR3M239_9TELE